MVRHIRAAALVTAVLPVLILAGCTSSKLKELTSAYRTFFRLD